MTGSGRPGPGYRGQRGRPRRPAHPAAAGPLLGQRIELDIGPVAHGGHCVGRHDGRVVFVRHALPGERVVAVVTEDGGGSYCRADAVEVLRPSADRVPPPCPHAGPGRCGGCDWQHASGPAQRALKAYVVREQLTRLAGLPEVSVSVSPLPAPAGAGLLGWRTRLRYAVGPDGRTGFRRHRSHVLEPVASCPLGTPEVTAVGAGQRRWPGAAAVEVAAAGGGDRAVTVWPSAPGRRPTRIGPPVLRERAAGRDWSVSTGGFWQVHPAAAETLAGCVLGLLRPRPGETAVDLYAGAGLFAGVLADAVGPAGRVLAVEGDRAAARDAAANLAGPGAAVEVRATAVTGALVADLPWRPDLAVLDPPRSGAGRDVVQALLGHGPRAVAYVACDPAALARDVRTAREAGYHLAALRAYDLFPMTAHVECVALLTPATPSAGRRPPGPGAGPGAGSPRPGPGSPGAGSPGAGAG